MTRSPRPLVEGAMLAAVAVVLVLLGNYLPLLGPFLLFAWPLPIVVIFVRHGWRVALLTVIVAWLLLTAFIGPVGALLDSIVLGSLGLALGWAAFRGLDAAGSVLAGTVAVIGSLFASLGLSRLFFHEDVLQQTQSMLNQTVQSAVTLYTRAGVPPQALAQMRATLQSVASLLPVVLPVLIILTSVAYALIAFLIARRVLVRLGQSVADLPAFAEWQVPAWSAAGLLGGFALLYLAGGSAGGPWTQLGTNLVYLFEMLYLTAGLAFAYFLARHWHLSRWLAVACLALIALNPLLNQLAMWAGLFDSVFKYRQVLKRRWEGGAS